MPPWTKAWFRWQLGMPLAMLVCVAILAASEYGQGRLQQGHAQVTGGLEAAAKLTRLVGMVAEAEASQRGFLLTSRKSYLESYESARPAINALVIELRDDFYNLHDKTVLDEYSAMVAVIREKLSEIDLTIRLAQQGKKTTAEELVLTDIGKEKMDQVRARATTLHAKMRESANQALAAWRVERTIARLTVAGIAILNLAILVILWRRLRADSARESAESARLKEDQERLDRLVAERTAQLEVLASHLQDVSETEKSALARELHDELGAILTASKMDVAWVRGKLAPDQSLHLEKLNRALRNLDSAVQAKRRIIEDLRPSTLATLGLVVALRELAEQMQSRAGWSLELKLPDEDPDIGEAESIALFRIAQESLNNAAKYARASRVWLALDRRDDRLVLEVGDDGTGFSPAGMRAKAHGIPGMRQRMIGLKGRLEVRTAVGEGTVITATLPRQRTEPGPLALAA